MSYFSLAFYIYYSVVLLLFQILSDYFFRKLFVYSFDYDYNLYISLNFLYILYLNYNGFANFARRRVVCNAKRI